MSDIMQHMTADLSLGSLGPRVVRSEEVRRLIASQIAEGRLQPGQRLPAEPALAKHYGISRPTLREILSGLESDGLVRRVHGVGTFVAHKPPLVQTSLDVDIGVTEAVLAANAKLGVDMLGAREEPPTAWMAAALGIKVDETVFAVERVISVDGMPAAHALDVMPLDVIRRAGSPVYGGGSIYHYLEVECGVRLHGGVASVSATLANTKMATALNCRRNSPLLRLDQTETAADGQSVLISREHYAPGVFNLTVRRLRHARTDYAGMQAEPQSRPRHAGRSRRT